MKVDRYTKFVLSVIAFCLVLLTLNNVDIFPKAYANEVVNYDGNYGLVPMNADGSINVRVTGLDEALDELDVNIVGVETYDKLKVDVAKVSTSDEMPVNIDELGGSSVSGSLPVSQK